MKDKIKKIVEIISTILVIGLLIFVWVYELTQKVSTNEDGQAVCTDIFGKTRRCH